MFTELNWNLHYFLIPTKKKDIACTQKVIERMREGLDAQQQQQRQRRQQRGQDTGLDRVERRQ